MARLWPLPGGAPPHIEGVAARWATIGVEMQGKSIAWFLASLWQFRGWVDSYYWEPVKNHWAINYGFQSGTSFFPDAEYGALAGDDGMGSSEDEAGEA